jgi:exodeoxyribonuclease V gamma subunit
VRHFFNQRLQVYLPEAQAADEDNEPFALDALGQYQAAQALLEAALAEPDNTAAAVARAERRLRDQGALPPAGFGEAELEAVARRAQGAIAAWREDAARWPQAADKHELHHEAHGLVLEDWLADLRRRGDGGHVRLLPSVSRLTQGRQLRYDRLLRPWCTHLAANAAGLRLESRLHGPDARLRLAELPQDQARALLDALLEALRQGMQAPPPVARQTAYAWLLADPDKPGAAQHAARAAYEGGDFGPRGEAEQDPHLARAWPRFAAMHAAGFEDWLHLYRPLLDATHREG